MQLPIKIFTTQFADQVLDLYQHYITQKNFGKHQTPYYMLGGDHDVGYMCLEYYRIDDINQHKDSVIFVDSLKEGWHVLEHRTDQLKKDKHYFIFSSADWDINDPAYQLPINYTLLYFPYFLYETVRSFTSFHHDLFFADTIYNFDYPKSLNFCSLSANARPHRNYLVNSILPDLDSNTYAVKLAGQNFGVNIEHLDIIKNTTVSTPQHYHTEASQLFDFDSAQHLPIDIYNISYYNLIAETNFEGSHFFPTEKIFKCLIAGIPFVCMATQNFLKRIRDLGFCTYNTVWDESYDSIESSTERLEKIKDLVVHLEKFNWNANRDKLIAIAKHNRIQFTKANEIFAECFCKMEYEIEQYRNI